MDPYNPPTRGFAKLYREVLFDKNLRPYDKLVFATLSSLYFEKSERGIIISQPNIAILLSCSTDAIKDAIKNLKRAGYISWKSGCTNRTNEYFLHIGNRGRLAPMVRAPDHLSDGQRTPDLGAEEHHLLEVENIQSRSQSYLRHEGRTCWFDANNELVTFDKALMLVPLTEECDGLVFFDGHEEHLGKAAYQAALEQYGDKHQHS